MMLFAKALSILFSLFAGLESAKGALYHYVCGKGKDRAFPYLAELKQEFVNNQGMIMKDVFVWTTPKDSLHSCLTDSTLAKHWQNDLYFTVGGFTVNATIIDEGILYEVSDYYDWHGTSLWGVPTVISNKLPKFVINLMTKNGFVLNCFGELAIHEDLLASFGTSYYHKGSFVLLWDEIDSYSLYSNIHNKNLSEELDDLISSSSGGDIDGDIFPSLY